MSTHLHHHGHSLQGGMAAFYAFLALIGAAMLGISLIRHAPTDLISLQALHIELPAGNETLIGRRQLLQKPGAGSAEVSHVWLRHDGKKGWLIANHASTKRVEILWSQGEYRFLKRWQLQQGDQLIINDQPLTVNALDTRSRSIALQDGKGNRWQWQRGQSMINGAVVTEPSCESTGAWWWRQWSSKPLRLFSVGGLYPCTDRFALADAPLRSAWVYWRQNGFWLAPGSADSRVYFSRGDLPPKTFSEIFLPLQSADKKVAQLIIGRTYYTVAINKDVITLTPMKGEHYWFGNELEHAGCRLSEDGKQCLSQSAHNRIEVKHVSWLGHGLSLPLWLQQHAIIYISLLAIAGLLSAPLLFIQRRGQFFRKAPYELAVVFPGVFGLGLTVLSYKVSPLPDMLWLLLLLWASWCWATMILLISGRLKGTAAALWFCALLFALFGSITLVQLSVGSLNGKWLAYAHKHIMVLTVFGWLVVLLNAVPVRAWNLLLVNLATGRSTLWTWSRHGIPLLLIFLLLLQSLFGSEKGVWGVQPVELAKFVLILVAAYTGVHILELRRTASRAYRENPFSYIFAAVLAGFSLLLFASMIMYQVRDFSPFLIIVSFVMAMAWRLAAHPQQRNPGATFLLRGLIALPIVLFVGAGVWIYRYSPDWMQWLPQHDRFRVWTNPAAFPHTGAQLLTALDFVHLGQWFGGTGSFFGYNENVEKVPAVHNDFIATFILFKFGGISALLLFLSQLYFLSQLRRLSHQFGYCIQPGDYSEREAFQVFAIVLFGILWMFAVHWLISWANVLSLLPVMGQPMSWISAANSHLLFFALPGFYIAMVLAWLAQSNEPADA